jgi:hypothetical protein
MARPPTGRQVEDKEKKVERYVTERRKADLGRHMRTFRMARAKELYTAYDHDLFLVALPCIVHSDSCAYLADGFLEAYTRGQKVGHMKDEEAAQKDAFDKTIDYGFELLRDLAAQWPWENLLGNFPRQDTVSQLGTGATGQVKVAHYEEATMGDILQKLDGMEFPKGLIKIVKDTNFYFKTSEAWIDGHKNSIPASYFIPTMPENASDTNKTLISLLWAEQGELRNHCQKFGIPLEKFSPDSLKPRELSLNDLDAIAYFQHAPLCYRATGGAANGESAGLYPHDEDNGENRKWFFKEDPNESVINFMPGLWHTYEADYNPYGGAMRGWLNFGANGDAIVVTCKQYEGTEMLSKDVIEVLHLIKNYKCLWEDDTVTNMELQGTELTNTDAVFANQAWTWPKSIDLELYQASGIDETSRKNTFLSYLIEILF